MRKVHEQVGHDCAVAGRISLHGAGRRRVLAGLAALAVAASMPAVPSRVVKARAQAAGAPPFGPWRAPLLREHPLAGMILDTDGERPIARTALEQRLRRHAVAILGEVHDNPDHHRIQGQLLHAFAAGRGKPPAVVFEMIPATMQQRLDSILGVEGLDADMIFDAVRWDESGWPSRDLYRPVMEAVVALRAPVIAAGVPRADVRKATRQGLDAVLPQARQQQMQLGPLPRALMEALVADIVKSHCDMIPPEVARRMSAAQRLRDAMLADGVRRGFRAQGAAVLITGNGHARKDRAVPFYLQRHGDVPVPLVVWQAEVRAQATRMEELLPEDALPPRKVADVVIGTPKAEREDPCAQFERFMRRKRGGAQ